MTFSRCIMGTALAAFLALPAAAVPQDRAEVSLRAAIEKETVEGDLKAAIDLYRKLSQNNNKSVAARALVRLGGCYEKQGNAEARKTYERVMSRFGDQKDAVAAAKARLAALGGGAAGAPAAHRVWTWDGGNLGPVSLDGRYWAYSKGNADGLTVRDMTTGEERRIASASDEMTVYTAVISPDSKWIAFGGQPARGSSQELRVAGMDGARPRTVFKTGTETKVGWIVPEGWTPDGREVLVTFNGTGAENESTGATYHVGLISVETGRLRVLKRFEFGYFRWAGISPDGKWVAYNAQTTPDRLECDIHVMRTDGTDERKLVDHPADDIDPVWTPNGSGLVFRSNRRGSIDAWFVRVKDGRAEGDPVMIKADVHGRLRGVTRRGTLFYMSETGSMDIHVATLNESTGALAGAVEKLPLSYTGEKRSPVLSPDGAWLAYLRPSLRAPRVNVVILRSMKTGEERELNPNVKELRSVEWYPDGKSLVLLGRDMRDTHVTFRMDATTGQATPLYSLFRMNGLNMNFTAPSVAPDGRTLYPPANTWTGVGGIVAVNSESKEFREIFRREGLAPGAPLVSPNGQQVASTIGGRSLIVVDSRTGEMRELCSLPPGGGRAVGWTPDGRHVVLARNAGEVWRVPVDGSAPQKVAIPGIHVMAQSAANRLVWTTGAIKAEIWALENAVPAR